jgi:predicted AAA+ superfamily ATPase
LDRAITKHIEAWYHSAERKPLILTGARQVGKTWIIKEFGRLHCSNTAYISFENASELVGQFEKTLDPKRLIRAISAATGVNVTPSTLIVFDEIQEAPRAITALKYFCEEAREYPIIAAGSSLGVALHKGLSFPVGNVDFIDMQPMSFFEFLDALGEKPLRESITIQNLRDDVVPHDKLVALLKEYMYVGGMPECVKAFSESPDYARVRKIQQSILRTYDADFSKYNTPSFSTKLRLLWNAIPAQLSKENKKFVFSAVKSGARARDFEVAIQWLIDCSMLYKVPKVSKPAAPLKHYEDFSAYKLFIHDIGLLCAMGNAEARSILDDTALFEEFKGALTEQLVFQELLLRGIRPYYWTNQSSTSEIDFLIENADYGVMPIEAKSGTNLRAKSLNFFIEKYRPKRAFRLSVADFKEKDALTDLPLYALGLIDTI